MTIAPIPLPPGVVDAGQWEDHGGYPGRPVFGEPTTMRLPSGAVSIMVDGFQTHEAVTREVGLSMGRDSIWLSPQEWAALLPQLALAVGQAARLDGVHDAGNLLPLGGAA